MRCIRRAGGMVINTNNCGYKGEYAPNYGVRHNGTVSYNSQSPPTYNHSWHVRDSTGAPLPPPATSSHLEERCSCSCWPRCEHYQGMRYPPPLPPISAANVIASYGVYHHQTQQHQEDEDGFVPNRPNAYKGVVVNVSGASSVLRPTAPPQEVLPQQEEQQCGCCQKRPRSTTASEQPADGCWWSWCRPTIVLLLLVLLVIVFVLVSAILLYYNCTLSVLHVLYTWYPLFYFITFT